MLITRVLFNSHQSSFYSHLLATPYKIKLIRSVVVNESDATAEFVGDRKRVTDEKEFQALYEKEISNRTREKYGLPMEVNGIVYLSPRQLVPAYGDFRLDWNTIKVEFEGRTQVIDKIIYLEELYGSCIGVQIFLKDALKGG